MKRLLILIICTVMCLTLLASCEHKHTYGELKGYEEGHCRPYSCGCPYPVVLDEHVDDDENGICDACGYEYVFLFKLTADKSGYELDRVGAGYKGGDVVIPSEYMGLPVVEIGYGAFKSENKLTSIAIPDSVTLISDDAFENQTSLTSVNVGKNVVAIGVSAFEGCTSLKTVAIGDATEYIYASAFEGCTALEAVTLGKNVKEITGSAFEKCTSLRTITIPDSIEKMGAWVFYGNNMTDIYFGVSQPGENWSEKWAEGINEGVNIHWREECTHQWDDGVEIDGGLGAYVMEYTCLLCGCKKREAIMIIPPEAPRYTISYQSDGPLEYLMDGFAPTEAEPGYTVVLRAYPIMDADLVLYANGVKLTNTHSDSDYWEYVFTMPEENVVITHEITGGF